LDILIEPPIDPENEFYYRLDESVNNSVQPNDRSIVQENDRALTFIREEQEERKFNF
jgi:hypothetical protein